MAMLLFLSHDIDDDVTDMDTDTPNARSPGLQAHQQVFKGVCQRAGPFSKS